MKVKVPGCLNGEDFLEYFHTSIQPCDGGVSFSLILLNFSCSWCQHWCVWHGKAGCCNPGSHIAVVHQMSFGRTCADSRLEVEYKWSILGRPWKWTFISLEDVFPSCQLSGCRVTISTLSLCFPPLPSNSAWIRVLFAKKTPTRVSIVQPYMLMLKNSMNYILYFF